MRQRFLFALAAWILILGGCLPQPQQTRTPDAQQPPALPTAAPTKATSMPTPDSTAPAEKPPIQTTIGDTAPTSFAAYKPYVVQVKPAIPAYDTDPARVANPALLKNLTAAQRTLLQENGFVVLPRGPEKMAAIYTQAREASIPVLVTVDALLHAFHILYDYTLRSVEIEHLLADLELLNEAMLARSLADLDAANSQESQEASRRNVAFFAVASALLRPETSIPSQVSEMVQQELALIEAHSGFAPSPILGYEEDYSQYVPRGHYTRSEAFERYFKCMMWYGRIGFHPTTKDKERARRETRQALMITAGLFQTTAHNQAAIDIWKRIYEPTVFFVGRADDLTPTDYDNLAQSLFGEPIGPTLWDDQDKLDAFRQATRDLQGPRIVGGLVDDTQDTTDETRSFRFMGQRFVYDSYIFQQLVYDQVGVFQGQGQPFTLSASDAGPVRGMPRGLDIAAVLNSDRALEILDREGDTAYQGYDGQMQTLRQEMSALPAGQWTENLYWGWLYSLRPLLTPAGPGYPAFMQNQAWTDKSLFTFLASWTELRHDTILYAKQSYTLRATSILEPPEPARGYVEPQPEVYARLAALAGQMRSGLEQRELLNAEFASKLQELEDVLVQLKTIAEKELEGQAPSDQDYELIQNIGSILDRLTTFSAQIDQQISSEADERMAIVADVHTDANTYQVLEQGVGDAFTLYAIVPDGANTQVAMGAVFSQYEFRQPMADRLNDETWQAMEKPPLAPWTSSFVAN
jgi:hypothetical protein